MTRRFRRLSTHCFSAVRFLGALLPAVLLSLSAAAETLHIPNQIEVETDSLVLTDIAQIDPPAADLARISIGYAPYAGQYRWIDKSDIEVYLRKSGVNAERIRFDMEGRVLILRKSQVISEARIRESVESFLRATRTDLHLAIKRIEFPGTVIVPVGEISIQVEPPASFAALNNLSLKLDFLVNGHHHRTQWIRAAITARSFVTVVNRDLPFGQKLQTTDLSLEERELDRLEDFFPHVEDAAGNVTKRAVRSGEILTRKDVTAPVLVRRGELVTLMARGRAFVVSTLARARDAGILGDHVLVENMDSRQSVQARIVGDKLVQVQLPEEIP